MLKLMRVMMIDHETWMWPCNSSQLFDILNILSMATKISLWRGWWWLIIKHECDTATAANSLIFWISKVWQQKFATALWSVSTKLVGKSKETFHLIPFQISIQLSLPKSRWDCLLRQNITATAARSGRKLIFFGEGSQQEKGGKRGLLNSFRWILTHPCPSCDNYRKILGTTKTQNIAR